MTKYKMEDHVRRIFSDMIDPVSYIDRIWNQTFEWQKMALDPVPRNIILMCARQSGKSTIVAGRGLHTAKHKRNALVLIVASSKDQAKQTMQKVSDFIQLDPELIEMPGDSTFEKRFINGSRVIVLPGTEKSVRSYSDPDLIIIDEASRVLDATYKALRPMRTGNPNSTIIILSTPWTKSGFFFKAWTKNPAWKKILVVPRYELIDGKIVERPKEEKFKAEYVKKGIDAFYSPRHSLEFLYEELGEIGPIWFRREYGCEFLEGMESVFDLDLIESAYDDSIKVEGIENTMYSENIKVDNFLDIVFTGE
ncbi:MAG: hypothetical protein E3J23_08650 [Candidatus Stahlbacteria bacterium]|nr:MAG: hypothetical protein E3J23_08650 [Candidatus Stahlbacteria bacterium]